MHRRKLALILLVVLTGGLPFGGGCGGGDQIERRAVSGTVRLDGNAVADGVVVFTPLGKGPSAGGKVKNGEFNIPKDDGPSPGKYRVELSAYRDTGKTYRDEASGHTIPVTESIIPPQYNRNSKLQVEVAETGKNHFEFDLQSRPRR